MKVVLVGAGNTATVLGRKMKECGTEIIQVISKSEKHAHRLASTLQTEYSNNLVALHSSAQLVIIAVNDQEIATVANQLPANNAIVVHTAGAVGIEVLQSTGAKFGVMYPVQSLSKNAVSLPEIPVLIDGNTDSVKGALSAFVSTWSAMPIFAGNEQRLRIHLAAVIANNFTNHIMALTEDFCKKEKVDFQVLLPIIKETVNRIQYTSPSLLQTGPASRGDIATIDKHLHHLNRLPELRKLYLKLTESIIVHQKLHVPDIQE